MKKQRLLFANDKGKRQREGVIPTKTIASPVNSNRYQQRLGKFARGDFMMKAIGLAVAILVFGLVTSANAAAPQNYTYQFRGLGASGQGYVSDSCGVRSVYFGVNQNTTHADATGKPVTSDLGYVSWYRFDWCSYTWSEGFALGDLALSGNSRTLNASGQLSGWDYSSGSGSRTVTVDVNITVDPSGNYSWRGENTSSYSSPVGSFHERYVGTYADATFSGSITLGSSNLFDGLTFSYANLYSANTGSVQLYRW